MSRNPRPGQAAQGRWRDMHPMTTFRARPRPRPGSVLTCIVDIGRVRIELHGARRHASVCARRVIRNPRRWIRFRRAVGALSVVLGSAMAVAHPIAHLANMRVAGALDLRSGFPVAATVILVGLWLIGLTSGPPESSRCQTD